MKIDTSPVRLQNLPDELLQPLEKALGMFEFWEHHRDCQPISVEGCKCGYSELREVVRVIREQAK